MAKNQNVQVVSSPQPNYNLAIPQEKRLHRPFSTSVKIMRKQSNTSSMSVVAQESYGIGQQASIATLIEYGYTSMQPSTIGKRATLKMKR